MPEIIRSTIVLLGLVDRTAEGSRMLPWIIWRLRDMADWGIP